MVAKKQMNWIIVFDEDVVVSEATRSEWSNLAKMLEIFLWQSDG